MKSFLAFPGRPATVVLSMILFFAAEVSVSAQPSARRWDWIPSGQYAPLLGDMWTFRCPPGGQFSVAADTMADNGFDSSNLDLYLEVTDATGALVGSADETNACEHASVCGFLCPTIGPITCGRGLHTVAVVSMPSDVCKGGGGYKLELTVFSRNGKPVRDAQTALGGGPKRVLLPRWADGVGPSGPLLNDEAIPTSLMPIGDATTLAREQASAGSTPRK
jgi:hypothetical protein